MRPRQDNSLLKEAASSLFKKRARGGGTPTGSNPVEVLHGVARGAEDGGLAVLGPTWTIRLEYHRKAGGEFGGIVGVADLAGGTTLRLKLLLPCRQGETPAGCETRMGLAPNMRGHFVATASADDESADSWDAYAPRVSGESLLRLRKEAEDGGLDPSFAGRTSTSKVTWTLRRFRPLTEAEMFDADGIPVGVKPEDREVFLAIAREPGCIFGDAPVKPAVKPTVKPAQDHGML